MSEHALAGNSGRVPLLDLLRFLSILGVWAYHYGVSGPYGMAADSIALPWLAPVARYGYLGVPTFFIISGFVIAYSAAGRTWSQFAVARFSRIYPTFVLCMSLTILVTFLTRGSSLEETLVQWAANLFLAAPRIGHAYADNAYWSLVLEVAFYAWVTALIAVRVFPQRIDTIVLVWFSITLTNELTIDSRWVERVFLTDYAGFFATGMMIHEIYKGRKDLLAKALLVLSSGVAVFNAIHNLGYASHTAGASLGERLTIAAVCLLSVSAILAATRVQRLPCPKLAIALGGITYPFYLLHQQLGYDLLKYFGSEHDLPAVMFMFAMTLFGSWLIWRYFERNIQHRIKHAIGFGTSRIPAISTTSPGRSG